VWVRIFFLLLTTPMRAVRGRSRLMRDGFLLGLIGVCFLRRPTLFYGK
jgi:hypothetical protein